MTTTPRPPDKPRSEADLLRGVGNGDPAAWDEIMRRYRGMVFAKARSFGLQDADAHDAVQMTWLRLAQNCHRIQLPHQLGGWLATTASRESLRILRPQARHPTLYDVVAERVVDPSIGPEQHVVDADTAQRLWGLVATLSPRCQTLLGELFCPNPRPHAEVARDTGIPLGSIGPTCARALIQLRCRPRWTQIWP